MLSFAPASIPKDIVSTVGNSQITGVFPVTTLTGAVEIKGPQSAAAFLSPYEIQSDGSLKISTNLTPLTHIKDVSVISLEPLESRSGVILARKIQIPDPTKPIADLSYETLSVGNGRILVNYTVDANNSTPIGVIDGNHFAEFYSGLPGAKLPRVNTFNQEDPNPELFEFLSNLGRVPLGFSKNLIEFFAIDQSLEGNKFELINSSGERIPLQNFVRTISDKRTFQSNGINPDGYVLGYGHSDFGSSRIRPYLWNIFGRTSELKLDDKNTLSVQIINQAKIKNQRFSGTIILGKITTKDRSTDYIIWKIPEYFDCSNPLPPSKTNLKNLIAEGTIIGFYDGGLIHVCDRYDFFGNPIKTRLLAPEI